MTPLEVGVDVSEKLTEMLSKNYNESLVLLNLAHLSDEEGKSVVKFEKGDLYDADCKGHIKEGFKVKKMQLSLDFDIDFTVNDELEFTGIKVSKDVLAGTADLGALIMMVSEINKVVDEVVGVFGDLR
mgnify:CR=1 FL=1